MSLRQKIENAPTVWLLGTLLAGFLAGFAAYQTILEVSGLVTVSKTEHESAKQAEDLVSKLTVKEGLQPKGFQITVTSGLSGDGPSDSLESVRLDEDFWITTNWIGLSGKRYYKQVWEIYYQDNLVATDWQPFVPKEDRDFSTWVHFKLNGIENKPGAYRVNIFLNDDKPIISKNITVTR